MISVYSPPALSIMGVAVTPFESYSHAVTYIEDIIACGRKSFCVAINPEKVYRAGEDHNLRRALNQADIGICDGIGIVLAAKILHGRTIKRCTGADLFVQLIGTAAQKGWKVFLLGAGAQSNEAACSKLREKYPSLQIVGSRDGFFQNSSQVVEEINASGADLLFVAMGSPRQEFWIAENRRAINASFCMGVGGTLDVISGEAVRAPRIFRKTGTEFLFRLLRDPRRWKRQKNLPLFMLRVLRKKLSFPRAIV